MLLERGARRFLHRQRLAGHGRSVDFERFGDSMMRQSAGTTSPAATSTMSPRTSSARVELQQLPAHDASAQRRRVARPRSRIARSVRKRCTPPASALSQHHAAHHAGVAERADGGRQTGARRQQRRQRIEQLVADGLHQLAQRRARRAASRRRRSAASRRVSPASDVPSLCSTPRASSACQGVRSRGAGSARRASKMPEPRTPFAIETSEAG